jgi:hypothetical protein
MGINLRAIGAELLALNIRKQGTADDRILAIDMKFKCEAPATLAGVLCGSDQIPQLWDIDSQEVDPLYFGISSILTNGVFQDHKLTFAKVVFDSVKITKCAFEPRPKGMIDLTFKASVLNPVESKISILADMVKEQSVLEVVAPPDLFE